MVVAGADVHKRTHTFVAVDEVGRKIGEKTVTAVGGGHAEAVMWARKRFDAAVVWAIEDCRLLSARLECGLFALTKGGAGTAETDGSDPGLSAHLRQVRSATRWRSLVGAYASPICCGLSRRDVA